MSRPVKEGELFKCITVFGKVFKLYYGYYEEQDRYSKLAELIPVYPNFIKNPLYTDDGYPFATEMQDICEHYKGDSNSEACYSCSHFKKGEELIGLCLCKERRHI